MNVQLKGVLMFNLKKLAAYTLSTLILSTTLCAVMPSDLLPDGHDGSIINGIFVRKGTVAATISNAKYFDLLKNEPDAQMDSILEDIYSLIPGMKALDMFNFFSPFEWIQKKGDNEGRVLVGIIYFQQYPEELTQEVIDYLTENRAHFSKPILTQIDKLFF